MSLSETESLNWWLGIATLVSLFFTAAIISSLPWIEKKFEKIAWISDVIFAWTTLLLCTATFCVSNMVSDMQEQLHGPRTITAEQRDQYKQFVANLPRGRVMVESVAQNTEAANFAQQIADMLKGSGYDVSETLGSLMPFGPPPIGVIIKVKEGDRPPIWAGPLLNGIKSINIAVSGGTGAPSDNSVTVFVGNKP